MDDVFQRQRMDVKDLGDRSQRFFAAQADDVDPHDGPLVDQFAQLQRIVHLAFHHAFFVIRHDAQRRRPRVGRNGESSRFSTRLGAATNPRLQSSQ